MPKRSRPRRAATLADAMAAGLAGEAAYWSSSPAAIEIPDLAADPENGRTLKVDPSVLGNLAAARGWIGIPAPRADGKRQRLTSRQRVAKKTTEAMRGIARQALDEATGAGLEGETAAMVAATDAAVRGVLVALAMTQGPLVGSPAVAAAEVKRGRKARERDSLGGKTSRKGSRASEGDIRRAMKTVLWKDYVGVGADIRYYEDLAELAAKYATERTGKQVSPYATSTMANKVRSLRKQSE